MSGEFFEEGAEVWIDGVPCEDTVFIDAQTLRCRVPPGDPGAADVTVINPDGQSGTLNGLAKLNAGQTLAGNIP